MATKIKFDGTGDGHNDEGVHFGGAINDYTLCGLTLDGDSSTAGGFDNTKEKVDCLYCIAIVELVKTIKRSEWV